MDALDTAGVRWPLEFRGQGAASVADGSHDIRAHATAYPLPTPSDSCIAVYAPCCP